MTDFAIQKSKGLFKAGMSFVRGQVTTKNDSSDDDDEPFDVNNLSLSGSSPSLKLNQKGIVIFNSISTRTNKIKIIQIHLYKGVIQKITSEGKIKKICSCYEILSISRLSETTVGIELKGPMDMQNIQKVIKFDTELETTKFHNYTEFISEFGINIRRSFDQIDYSRAGLINRNDLIKALARVDLKATNDDITNMLELSPGRDGIYCYSDFFHLFQESFVSNLRECLQEWLIQAINKKSKNDSTTSTVPPPQVSKEFTTSTFKADQTGLNTIYGEVVAFAPSEKVYWCVFNGKPSKAPFHLSGSMYATNYRISLMSHRKQLPDQNQHTRYDVPALFDIISIPLTTITKIYVAPPRNSMYIQCKDYRTVRITITGIEVSKSKVDTFTQLLQGITFCNRSSVFAFIYAAPLPKGLQDIQEEGMNASKDRHKNQTMTSTISSNLSGWQMISLFKEFDRQGLLDGNSSWKIFDNSDWSRIETYPSHLVLPKAMADSEIEAAIAFRSKGRLPAITYVHKKTGATLSRSSQPMVGITFKNSTEDAMLLNLYRTKGKLSTDSEEYLYSKLYILDARGRVTATLNMAVGKGTEDVSLYQNAELIFCNIDNIHVMRNSAMAFAEAISTYAGGSREHVWTVNKDVSAVPIESAGFHAKVEESGWLKHICLLLSASILAAEKIHFESASVLVHCSDGWDRTAQMCSIAQVLLDPYFRTIEGFALLIEKDWCAFGHKFQDRFGHGQDASVSPEERSPVFLQFLDAIFQILHQFPTVFEFSEKMLIFIADHVNSCLFGNFLGNCDKERNQELNVRETTKSIWSYIFDRGDYFKNNHLNYKPYPEPIWPTSNLSRLVIWDRYWMRWSLCAHPNSLNVNEQWHDDWGSGPETLGSQKPQQTPGIQPITSMQNSPKQGSKQRLTITNRLRTHRMLQRQLSESEYNSPSKRSSIGNEQDATESMKFVGDDPEINTSLTVHTYSSGGDIALNTTSTSNTAELIESQDESQSGKKTGKKGRFGVRLSTTEDYIPQNEDEKVFDENDEADEASV